MEALQKDPKAMEIFLDELQVADSQIPKGRKFFDNMSVSTFTPIPAKRQNTQTLEPMSASVNKATKLTPLERNIISPDKKLNETGTSFLYCLDRKEYYNQFIHKQNKAIFAKRVSHEVAPGIPSNFVIQTKETKETFDQRVDRHMKKLMEDSGPKIKMPDEDLAVKPQASEGNGESTMANKKKEKDIPNYLKPLEKKKPSKVKQSSEKK